MIFASASGLKVTRWLDTPLFPWTSPMAGAQTWPNSKINLLLRADLSEWNLTKETLT